MLDSEFRELVSQYVDGELSADEISRLREEVRQFPRRRAEFERFLRINGACRLACSLDAPERRVIRLPGLAGWFFDGEAWRRLLRRSVYSVSVASVLLLVGFVMAYQWSLSTDPAGEWPEALALGEIGANPPQAETDGGFLALLWPVSLIASESEDRTIHTDVIGSTRETALPIGDEAFRKIDSWSSGGRPSFRIIRSAEERSNTHVSAFFLVR